MSAIARLVAKLARIDVDPYVARRGAKLVPVAGHMRLTREQAEERSHDPEVLADVEAFPDKFFDVDSSIALYRKLGVSEPWNLWEWPRRLAAHRRMRTRLGLARVELSRVFIPPYRRWRFGRIEDVDGYWLEIDSVADLSPEELDAFARSGASHPELRPGARPVSARVASAALNPSPLLRSHRADDPSARATDIGTDVPGDPAATAYRRKLRSLAWTPSHTPGWETAEDEDFVYSRPYGSTDVRRVAALPKARFA